MRRLIKRLIKGVLADVYECSDGSQALEAYTTHHPDWVLMDIEMKDVDGITATRQSRATFPDARIVIVSNYDSDEVRAAAREAGAWAFYSKANLLSLRSLMQGTSTRGLRQEN
jgi:two-component system response regulator DegU